MPALERDEDEGVEHLPPQKRPKLHHDDGEGTEASSSKPGNSRTNMNANPPSSPNGLPKLPTAKVNTPKVSATKTPARSSKKNIPSSAYGPKDNLNKQLGPSMMSSPTPQRVVGASKPTNHEEAKAISKKLSRGLLERNQQTAAQLRSNPKRTVKSKSREASVTNPSEEDDELSQPKYNPTRSSNTEVKRPKSKLKEHKEKATGQRVSPIDVDADDASGEKKRRKKSPGFSFPDQVSQHPDHQPKRLKISERLQGKKVDQPEPGKPKRTVRRKEHEYDDLEIEEGEPKPTNFTGSRARTRNGGRSPTEKMFDLTSTMDKDLPPIFPITSFSWVGFPDLEYPSAENSEKLFICVVEICKDPEKAKAQIVVQTKNREPHTRIEMGEIGVYAYDFKNSEMIMCRSQALKGASLGNKWIRITFPSSQILQDFQEQQLSPASSSFKPAHQEDTVHFEKQKKGWLHWHNIDAQNRNKAELDKQVASGAQRGGAGHNAGQMDASTKEAIDNAIAIKQRQQRPPGNTLGRGLKQLEKRTVPSQLFKATGGKRLGDGKAEPDWEFEHKPTRSTRSSGVPLFGPPEQPRRSNREKAPKKEVPKLLLPEKVWETPLVFPPTGRDRAIVEYDDLTRLNQGEFLNDNLINFYLKLTESRLKENDPELAKRTHFFNTFFYERLKRKEDGKRDYAAMKNWTKNVDLFEKDFIFVPINEFAHWYLAIICNLTNLPRILDRMNAEELNLKPETEQAITVEQAVPVAPVGPGAPLASTEEVSQSTDAPGDPMQGVEMESDKLSHSQQHLTDDGIVRQPDLLEGEVDSRDEIPDSQASQSPEGSQQNTEVERLLQELAPHAPQDKLAEELAVPSSPASTSFGNKAQASANPTRRTSPRNRQKEPDPTSPTENMMDDGVEKLKVSQLDGAATHDSKEAVPVVEPEATKINKDAPIIFILDSLGAGPNQHNSTIQNLRKYIEAVALDKRSQTIPNLTTAIQGGYADVPEQPNHCDCGVFLLHYVERFLQQPERFLESFFQRKISKKRNTDMQDWNPERITGMREEILDLICEKKDELDGVQHVPRKVRLDQIEAQKKADASRVAEEKAKEPAMVHSPALDSAIRAQGTAGSKDASRQPTPNDDSDIEVVSVSNVNQKKAMDAAKKKAETTATAALKKQMVKEQSASKETALLPSVEGVPTRPKSAQEAPTAPVVEKSPPPRKTRSAAAVQVLSPNFQLTMNDIKVGPNIPPALRVPPPKKGPLFGAGSRGPKTPESSDTEDADPPPKALARFTAGKKTAPKSESAPPALASKPEPELAEKSKALEAPLPSKEARQSTPIRQVSSTPQGSPLKRKQQQDPDSPAKRKATQEAVQMQASPSSSLEQSPVRIPSTQEGESSLPKSMPQKNEVDLTDSPKSDVRKLLSPSPEPTTQENDGHHSSGTLVEDVHDDVMIDLDSSSDEHEDRMEQDSSTGSDGEAALVSPPIDVYEGGRTVHTEDGVMEIYPPMKATPPPPENRAAIKNGIRDAEEGFRSMEISPSPEKKSRDRQERDPYSTPAPRRELPKPIHLKFESSPNAAEVDGDFQFNRTKKLEPKRIEPKLEKLHIPDRTSPLYHTNPRGSHWVNPIYTPTVRTRTPDSDWKGLDKYQAFDEGPEPEEQLRLRRPPASERTAQPAQQKQAPEPITIESPPMNESSTLPFPRKQRTAQTIPQKRLCAPFKSPMPQKQPPPASQSALRQDTPPQTFRKSALQHRQAQSQELKQPQLEEPMAPQLQPQSPQFTAQKSAQALPAPLRAPVARTSGNQESPKAPVAPREPNYGGQSSLSQSSFSKQRAIPMTNENSKRITEQQLETAPMASDKSKRKTERHSEITPIASDKGKRNTERQSEIAPMANDKIKRNAGRQIEPIVIPDSQEEGEDEFEDVSKKTKDPSPKPQTSTSTPNRRGSNFSVEIPAGRSEDKQTAPIAKMSAWPNGGGWFD